VVKVVIPSQDGIQEKIKKSETVFSETSPPLVGRDKREGDM
jgi:hypothetical protein